MAFTIISCKRSNEKRIVGTWKVVSVIKDSKDETSNWTKHSYTEMYTSDGVYIYSGQPDDKAGSGSYLWNETDKLTRFGVNGQSTKTLTIINLDKSNFKYQYFDGNEAWIFTLVK